MNNPNPFVPQGSLLEQNKRRSRMKLAVFCVLAVSVCGLTAMLIQGCKREQSAETLPPPVEPTAVAPETNPPPLELSNQPVMAPAETNPSAVVAPVTPPATVAPAAPEATGTEYVVVKGDTLGKIAKAHGVSLKALEAANPGVVPTKLKIGQKLSIPAGGSAAAGAPAAAEMAGGASAGGETYTVKAGDTLTRIARVHGVTLKMLEAANPNLDPSHIKVGQKLNLPAAAAAAAPAPVAAPAPAAPVTPPPAATPNGQ